jgi:hypothetical protein
LRKALEFVALAGLGAVWAITAYALLGPHPLPDRIPIHFDLAGKPDGWGDPRALWLLPAFGTVLYGLMTIIARFPNAFNYPVRVTPANRAALQELALTMIAWLKAEVLWLFVWIQHSTIQAAAGSRAAGQPVSILLPIAVVFGTVCWYVVAMRRAARSRLPR